MWTFEANPSTPCLYIYFLLLIVQNFCPLVYIYIIKQTYFLSFPFDVHSNPVNIMIWLKTHSVISHKAKKSTLFLVLWDKKDLVSLRRANIPKPYNATLIQWDSCESHEISCVIQCLLGKDNKLYMTCVLSKKKHFSGRNVEEINVFIISK